MNKFGNLTKSTIIAVSFITCTPNSENTWDTNISTPEESVKITDISGKYFDKNISDEDFKNTYPWFQGSVSDSLFSARRKDENSIKIYDDIKKTIQTKQIEEGLSDIFRRIKMYFPQYESPKVYTYSSDAQMYLDPIIYSPEEKVLFIDLSCFLGKKYNYPQNIENYLINNMTPENILPKTAEAIAKTMVPYYRDEQKFIDIMVYEGKIKVLQEAFCPKISPAIRLNNTQEQFLWTKENEANIWNYFIEKDLLFTHDPKLIERFIAPAPFSKFYIEIDKEASPQVGIYIGKAICDAYLKKHGKDLQSFLSKNNQQIFAESGYKPK